MGRNHNKRIKKRGRSDTSEDNDSFCKAGKFSDSPKDEAFSVSNLLKETNSVLFSDDGCDAELDFQKLLSESSDRVCNKDSSMESRASAESTPVPTPTHKPTMSKSPQTQTQTQSKSPSNADIMAYLKTMNNKMCNMEKKLDKIDILEQKVDVFEKEMSKLWVYIQDNNKQLGSRISTAEDRVEAMDFSLGVVNDKVVQLEKERDSLKDEVVYLTSQSMRNNLVFAGIDEAARGTTEDCEKTLREFLARDMQIAQDLVDKLSFERVHRMGQRSHNKTRKIVAKFTLFKEREMVRRQWKALEGTNFYVHEQFPREVVDKRRKLLPLLKEAKKDNKRAWLSYDTLYIDGKPVRDANSR